jgi:hypothetical protein
MAEAQEPDAESPLVDLADSGRQNGPMTAELVVEDLRNLLAKHPSIRLKDARSLCRATEAWLREVGVRGVEAEVVVKSELAAILSEPLVGNGDLLAAGWLLRMRPSPHVDQAKTDLGGESVGVPAMSATEVADGLKSGDASAFRQVAALCLQRWSERWSAKKLAQPRTAFQPTSRGLHSPRTRDVAGALSAALDQRLADLASDPPALRRRHKAWKRDASQLHPEPESRTWKRKIAHFTWSSTRRRVVTSIVAGIVLVGSGAFVANGLAAGPTPLTRTEVLVYRPSLPEVPPEPTGSRYFDLTCMESNTSPRRDARLCVTVNAGPTWDPCFEIDEHYVSCPSPTITGRWNDLYGVNESVRPVIQNVERADYPVNRQLSIDEAAENSRPWAIVLQEPLSGENRLCIAKYDDVLNPLPVKFACVGWEVRYALDIQAIINGTDQGATANFTDDSSVVFDLDQSQPVWTVRAPDGPNGVYRQVEVAAAYF